MTRSGMHMICHISCTKCLNMQKFLRIPLDASLERFQLIQSLSELVCQNSYNLLVPISIFHTPLLILQSLSIQFLSICSPVIALAIQDAHIGEGINPLHHDNFGVINLSCLASHSVNEGLKGPWNFHSYFHLVLSPCSALV